MLSKLLFFFYFLNGGAAVYLKCSKYRKFHETWYSGLRVLVARSQRDILYLATVAVTKLPAGNGIQVRLFEEITPGGGG